MKKLSLILQSKENALYTIGSQSTVYEALVLMTERNISAVLVVDDNRLSGIFTERDYARKVVLKGKSSKEIQLSEVMTLSPIVVAPDDSVESCMEIMTERHIRHLPVMHQQELIGMISIGDVVKFVIKDQKQTIQDLENYIKS